MAKKLRTGFTTGTAAAAAAKAAVSLILDGKAPNEVRIRLLTGDDIVIPVNTCQAGNGRTATCTVIKDAGDDPDVTHRAEIGAAVTMPAPDSHPSAETTDKVFISGRCPQYCQQCKRN